MQLYGFKIVDNTLCKFGKKNKNFKASCFMVVK